MWEYLPVALSVLGSLTSASGASNAGDAAIQNGLRQQAAARFTAAQLKQQGEQSFAASQRTALDQQRTATIMQSRALALAAAGGGGASDPTVISTIARIGSEGAYRASVALYQGEEAMRVGLLKSEAANYEGDLALQSGYDKAAAYKTQASGSLLSGAGSLFAKFGMAKGAAAGADAGWTSGYDLPMGSIG